MARPNQDRIRKTYFINRTDDEYVEAIAAELDLPAHKRSALIRDAITAGLPIVHRRIAKELSLIAKESA